MDQHELYRLDPAEFVAARDQLAKELRAEGEREEATKVKALRRPTVPAWALNRVSHEHGDEVEALIDAAAAARRAQEEVLGGGDRETLREALNARRSALRAVAHLARDGVEASGRSGDAQEREIDAALLAIVDSTELTDTFRRGELVDVRVTTGSDDDDVSSMFGASLSVVPSTGQKRPAKSSKPAPKLAVVKNEPDAAKLAKIEAAREALSERKKEAAAAAKQLAAAQKALAQAEDAVTKAELALRELE